MYIARDFRSPLECVEVCFSHDKALEEVLLENASTD